MRFDFDDEQAEIKETARQFLAARFTPAVVRELAEGNRYDDALWAEVSELGWPGIAIAEEHGGQGLGMVELIVLCEELGYACAPLPFLANACAGLVLAFLSMSALEPLISQNLADATNARMLADSGIDLAFNLEQDSWNGEKYLQLSVADFRAPE